MKVVEEAAFSALLCDKCGGMFYPEDQFIKHLHVVRARLPAEPSASEQQPKAAPWAVTVGEAGKPCPACGAPFRRFNYAGAPSLMIAKCSGCSGLWLEPGQMLRIARHHALAPEPAPIVEQEAREPLAKLGVEDEIKSVLPGCTFIPLPLFPLSAAGIYGLRPVAMWTLIAVTSMLFLLTQVVVYGFGVSPEDFLAWFAMVPAEVTSGRSLHTLITYQFVHASVLHLAGNMVMLSAFADRVEDRVGPARFVAIYLGLGVVAGLAQAFLHPDSATPCVGASGAVSGIIGTYMVLFPLSNVRLCLVFLTVPFPALIFFVLWFVLQATIPSSSNIAVAAHFGGFFAGAWLGGAIRILRLGRRGRIASLQENASPLRRKQ
jgi:membrane associated rhomboid family serine protease